MASFISSTSDRPEAFSLFACAPQPLSNNKISGADDGVSPADALMRMQLKVTDSTKELSDKDVKQLTIVKHSVSHSFQDLSALCENMAGVTELVFGLRSPVVTMLRSWVEFLSRSGGMTTAGLRQLAHTDPTSPARLGWFIERRLQQYLTACAAADHIDSVDFFAFNATRQQLEDDVFCYPLCAYLQARLAGKKGAAGPPPPAFAGSRGGSAQRRDNESTEKTYLSYLPGRLASLLGSRRRCPDPQHVLSLPSQWEVCTIL
jgi:hypothetical protein